MGSREILELDNTDQTNMSDWVCVLCTQPNPSYHGGECVNCGLARDEQTWLCPVHQLSMAVKDTRCRGAGCTIKSPAEVRRIAAATPDELLEEAARLELEEWRCDSVYHDATTHAAGVPRCTFEKVHTRTDEDGSVEARAVRVCAHESPAEKLRQRAWAGQRRAAEKTAEAESGGVAWACETCSKVRTMPRPSAPI